MSGVLTPIQSGDDTPKKISGVVTAIYEEFLLDFKIIMNGVFTAIVNFEITFKNAFWYWVLYLDIKHFSIRV